MRKKKGERGFTLVEIMVVVLILAVLAAIVVPKLMMNPDKAKVTAAKVQIRQYEQAIQMYKLDNGIYPSTEQGLDALVTKPTVGEIPKNYRDGGYISKIQKDPWGHGYVYTSPGAHGDFDLLSYGADGEQGGDGVNADIQNWNME